MRAIMLLSTACTISTFVLPPYRGRPSVAATVYDGKRLLDGYSGSRFSFLLMTAFRLKHGQPALEGRRILRQLDLERHQHFPHLV